MTNLVRVKIFVASQMDLAWHSSRDDKIKIFGTQTFALVVVVITVTVFTIVIIIESVSHVDSQE